ncbi:unnamed protein product, partial [Effrenium voratum]
MDSSAMQQLQREDAFLQSCSRHGMCQRKYIWQATEGKVSGALRGRSGAMVCVEVALLSGHAVRLEVVADLRVHELKWRAQQQLGLQLQSLASTSGQLKEYHSLLEAGVRDGDLLTATVCNREYPGHRPHAFALVRGDGSVAAWGARCWPAPQLRDAVAVAVSFAAFAARRRGGGVATWGKAHYGGDSNEVQEQLQGVEHIEASYAAFAALRADGTVVTWGDSGYGGDSAAVQEQLRDVRKLKATRYAFAAISGDGRVVTWGDPGKGGNSGLELLGVRSVAASSSAFAAVRSDGAVVAWGDVPASGESPRGSGGRVLAPPSPSPVVQLVASGRAFAALRCDGSVATWGDKAAGGDSSCVQPLRGVQSLVASSFAFAALLGDGGVVTWGNPRYGGDSSLFQAELRQVQ